VDKVVLTAQLCSDKRISWIPPISIRWQAKWVTGLHLPSPLLWHCSLSRRLWTLVLDHLPSLWHSRRLSKRQELSRTLKTGSCSSYRHSKNEFPDSSNKTATTTIRSTAKRNDAEKETRNGWSPTWAVPVLAEVRKMNECRYPACLWLEWAAWVEPAKTSSVRVQASLTVAMRMTSHKHHLILISFRTNL
jgi:hypothetical protein